MPVKDSVSEVSAGLADARPRLRPLNRPLPSWAWSVAALALTAVAGVAAGIAIAPQRPPTYLAYCSVAVSDSLYMCPPDSDRWVQAYWDGVVTVARWTGSRWEFRRPVMNQPGTVRPALAWTEIPVEDRP